MIGQPAHPDAESNFVAATAIMWPKGDRKGMVRASIRELKDCLSHYLRLTKRGQVVEITERGKPIGRIVPLESDLGERLEAMAKLGILIRREKELSPRAPVAKPKGSVAELLIEERG